MDTEPNLIPLVAGWCILATLILVRHVRRGQSVGLLLSYVLSLGALHWFAPALYLLPWSESPAVGPTLEGLRQSVYAMVGLALGAEAMALYRRSSGVPPVSESDTPALVPTAIVNVYLIGGAVMYVLSFSVAGRLPSVRALIVTGSTLMVVGVALKCWNAWHTGSRTNLWFWLAATTIFPLVTVATQGYLGYGFAAMVMVFAFFAGVARLTWRSVALGMLLSYAGLSVYVTYMRDRAEIRETVWYGGSTSERLHRLQDTMTLFEWFHWQNQDHLERIHMRLNQDFYIGAAVRHLESGSVEFARGATLLDAALAIIPRAFWPDKPMSAGSGDLMSTYTGFRFAEGTSVGIGQVLECYINFGVPGVVIGFFLIGALLVLIDQSAAGHLTRGDPNRFLTWYLTGLSLLQVGGSLTEVTASAAASYGVALLFVQITRHLPQGQRSPLSPSPEVEAAS